MEQQNSRGATSMSGTASVSTLPTPAGDGHGVFCQRRPASLISARDAIVQPPSIDDPLHPEPRASPPESIVQHSSSAVTVPRRQRRRLLPGITVIAEISDPYEYSDKSKWLIVFVAAYAAAAAPLGSAIFFPSLTQIASDLDTSREVVNLTVALYMFSLALGPMWWSHLSEVYGRRSVLLVSFALFTVFVILCALSTSIAMLLLMRMLSGGAAASAQVVGAGTIADSWKPIARGQAVSRFYLGPLCGPLLAPVIGGALSQKWGWRSTMWFLSIYGGTAFVLILIALPETLARTKKIPKHADDAASGPLTEGSSRSRVSSPLSRRAFCRRATTAFALVRSMYSPPLEAMRYLRFPAVLLTVYYASITFGSLYVMNISIQDTFHSEPYGFSTAIIGLLYLPASLGYVFASIANGKWMDRIMAREARKAERRDEAGQVIYRPEDRMRENAWLGALSYPFCLIVYGWTAQMGVHWGIPMVALFFFGGGSMILFSLTTTMLTEFLPKRSSAGVALNNLMRNIFAAIGCLLTIPLTVAIGSGLLFTILGILTLASASVIWCMKHYGPRWRCAMDGSMR